MVDNSTKEPPMDLAYFQNIFYNSSVACTILSIMALIINLYLLNCSRFLRRPIGVNLRLCVSLTASDALAAFCYILTYTINVIFPSNISNCWSLLLEVIKLTTFFASVSTLLVLALNHYVGIVYPLRRHVITIRSVRITILLSYVFPFAVFCLLFCLVPGGFSAPISFGFFRSDGCASSRILRNPIVRSVIVGPFIIFTLLVSFLYCHIIWHMGRTTKDPLLKNNTIKRKYNAKLLGTLALLAGSAVIGWLPTTVLFALICQECIFPIAGTTVMYLTILSQVLNIVKLMFDAFIYASRLVEIRYAMWQFHTSVYIAFNELLGKKRPARHVPPEFVKYLNETKEHRSVRSRRANHSSRMVTPTLKTDNFRRCESAVVHETRNKNNMESVHKPLVVSHSMAAPIPFLSPSTSSVQL